MKNRNTKDENIGSSGNAAKLPVSGSNAFEKLSQNGSSISTTEIYRLMYSSFIDKELNKRMWENNSCRWFHQRYYR